MNALPVRGMIYVGSVEEARGAVVIDVWECPHNHSSDRVTAMVQFDGRTEHLHHARPESFCWPDQISA